MISVILTAAAILALIGIDQAIKLWAIANLQGQPARPFLQLGSLDWMHLRYMENSGAAFSMLQGHPTLLIVLPAAVIFIGIIFVLVRHKAYNRTFMVSISLICAGGLGNLTDRMSAGVVTDMFDFRVFPVFNVADISVCVGCGLMILYMIIYNNRSASNGK